MRKINLLPLLMSLFMVGCSQDEPSPGNGEDNAGMTTSYLSVNLVNSDDAGSRAASSGGYDDGDKTENFVKKVRFYFFNAAGGAMNVKPMSGEYVNYYDWTPGSDQSNDVNTGDDIEKKLPATIVITTPDGDKLPQAMAAVLNPPVNFPDGSKSLTELKIISADYADPQLTKEGTFVMFSSVYAKSKREIITVGIGDKIKSKKADAIADPVDIYVERNVAKVEVAYGLGEGVDISKIKLKDKDGNDLKVQGQQVYLKIEGWGLTAETNKGRLVKKINAAGWPDNYNTSYRSCWGINDMDATNEYHKYSSIGTPTHLYTNENAQLTDINGTAGLATEKTKVIIRGTHLKEDGTPFTIVRHMGYHFADDYSKDNEAANLLNLKKSILDQFTSNKSYYYQDGDDRKGISVGDLKIVVATQVLSEGSKNNCFVYAQLTDDAKKKTWFASKDADAQQVDPTTIDDDLKNKANVDWALVWNEGRTYYYYEIEHLHGQVGVVRNHVYRTRVTKIAGLGTPVYDPEEVIYPEKPDPNDHYIAARINILSWHIVNNDYELNWN